MIKPSHTYNLRVYEIHKQKNTQRNSPNLEILGSSGCSTLALWYPKPFLFTPKIKCSFTYNSQLTFFPQVRAPSLSHDFQSPKPSN